MAKTPIKPTACPRCAGELERIRRTALDRLIGLLAPSRRYRCQCRACGWSGLRPTSPARLGTYVGHLVLEPSRVGPAPPPDRLRGGR